MRWNILGWFKNLRRRICPSFNGKDFLTHKLVVNNGEVPQYYVEGHHEGILTADQFDQVQAEPGDMFLFK